jgi:DNA-binding response OmpR family regulator
MRRRILLVDDDLAVLLTLKAVLELQGFEVETANGSSEAFERLKSATYQMVISDLRMEREDSGLEVLRAARRQTYNPATALLTAYPPERLGTEEEWKSEHSDSILIKPLGIKDLLRQVEALLVSHADKSDRNKSANQGVAVDRKKSLSRTQSGKRSAS